MYGILDFGSRFCRHRPTGPHAEVLRSYRLDVNPTLARVPKHFAGRARHATVKRRRRPARYVHRRAHGHANRARLGPLFRCKCINIIILYNILYKATNVSPLKIMLNYVILTNYNIIQVITYYSILLYLGIIVLFAILDIMYFYHFTTVVIFMQNWIL